MTCEKKCKLLTELGHHIVSYKYQYPYGDRFIVKAIDDIEYYVGHTDQKEARIMVNALIDFYTRKGAIVNGRIARSIL